MLSGGNVSPKLWANMSSELAASSGQPGLPRVRFKIVLLNLYCQKQATLISLLPRRQNILLVQWV